MTYGYRRIHAELRGNMMDINHKKVARLMRENNIFSKKITMKITILSRFQKTCSKKPLVI
jgi:hypothetical protein